MTSIPVGDGPTGITVGDGAVWVVDSLDDRLVRIDPGTQSLTETIPGGAVTHRRRVRRRIGMGRQQRRRNRDPDRPDN
ncbi:MAG: hypothetical protein ACLP8S_30160 [Solirubrobacteraceae bacterium]